MKHTALGFCILAIVTLVPTNSDAQDKNSRILEIEKRFREGLIKRGCKIPLAKTSETILIGSSRSKALTDVTLKGRDQVTELTKVSIEPGAKQLYVMVGSKSPMIWEFTGATERVEHLVISKGPVPLNDERGAGVLGLPQSRVTIMGCSGNFDADTMGLWGVLIGRTIKHSFHASAISEVSIPKFGIIRDMKQPQAPTIITKGKAYEIRGGKMVEMPQADRPSYVDSMTWQMFQTFNSLGVRRVKLSNIVSDDKFAKHAVLPQYAGLLQLMKEGKLARRGHAYVIRKPILRFPAGLHGPYAAKFILPRGMPMPAGDPGHSKVIRE